MEMLPPPPVPPAANLVVGATIEKRFPGYGVHRGTVAEIDGGRVVVHWATNERTTLSLTEATKRVIAIPLAGEDDDDDQSVTSAAFGIESSATSFTAPRHVLLELDDDDDRSRDGGAGTEHEATLVPPENCEACAVPLRTAGRGGGDSIVAITSSTSIALGARAENITAWPAAHGRDLIRGCAMRVGARTRAHALAPYSA